MAAPRSRNELSEFAKMVRKVTEMENVLYFPIINFMESVLPQIFPEFYLVIGTQKEMGNRHGITCRDENYIMIREDVYDGACRGEGRDRFTCAHEVGHFLLHSNSSVKLARLEKGLKIKPYEDPEWQANAFAGELLVPNYLVKGMKAIKISLDCGVSVEAARIQISKH
jgi:Zn-dependent peptidase ImmA (M78 family)